MVRALPMFCDLLKDFLCPRFVACTSGMNVSLQDLTKLRMDPVEFGTQMIQAGHGAYLAGNFLIGYKPVEGTFGEGVFIFSSEMLLNYRFLLFIILNAEDLANMSHGSKDLVHFYRR